MPKSTRRDPFGAYNFIVEIDGIAVAGFTEASGLETETEIIEYREGNESLGVRKLPGLNKFHNLTLEKGTTENQELWNWRKRIIDGQADRRLVSVILLDRARNAVQRWIASEAWPSKWEGPAFNAKSNEVAIETLEIACESLELSS